MYLQENLLLKKIVNAKIKKTRSQIKTGLSVLRFFGARVSRLPRTEQLKGSF